MAKTILAMASLGVMLCARNAALAGETESVPSRSGIALVELFTSEGCSSCPPADKVAADIARRAESLGTPVYVLAFHVDYWDYLGWTDRFASPDYSARQRAYAKESGKGRVYTPQMIVNGAAEFVGSDRERATREIDAAVQSSTRTDPDTPPVTITIDVDPVLLANLRHRVSYDVTGLDDAARAGAVLHLAVVEGGLTSDVTRGENAGKTLRHDGVVRWFASVPIDEEAQGRTTIHVPGDADPDRTSVVAWVQEGEVGRVLTATSVRLAKVSDGSGAK